MPPGPIQNHFQNLQAGILGQSFFDLPMDFHKSQNSDKDASFEELEPGEIVSELASPD